MKDTLADAFDAVNGVLAGITQEAAKKEKEKYLPLMAERILEDIISSKDYSYDMNADNLYRQYADMYKKQASLASDNAFGLASALSGGYANSYAATAASKAADKAYSGLYDKAMELEDKAYERYVNGLKEKYELLDAIKLVGSVNNELSEKEFDKAEFFAEYGDLSELQKLGVNTDSLSKKELTDMAEVFAKYGDYSLLKILGVNTSGRETEDLYNRLLLQAKYKKA